MVYNLPLRFILEYKKISNYRKLPTSANRIITTVLRKHFKGYTASKNVYETAVTESIKSDFDSAGYTVVEVNVDKPWGAYLRIANEQADDFVADFFPDLTPEQARLGMEGAELSPKILIVAPGHRLSWQYHNRRAERWMFVTNGTFTKSSTDEPGEIQTAAVGDVLQFHQGERHRLIGLDDSYVVVAEIWQHADSDNPSDEDDIVRLANDYSH